MQHELNIASSFIFLNMAIKVLELDKEHIINGYFKVKSPYIKLVDTLISKAIKQRRQLKMTMQQQNINVDLLYRKGDFTYYKFVVNRSQTVKCYFNPVIKQEVEQVISRLIFA